MAKATDLIGFPPLTQQQLGYIPKAVTGAGTTSATATVCDAQSNFFILTTSASTDGLRMSADAPLFSEIWISNAANGGKIYPHTGGTVNGGSTDASESITATTVHIWMRISSTAWVAVLGA